MTFLKGAYLMDRINLYKNIAERTQGSIYIGLIGPVRTGKSTFIKRFMDLLVIPNIEDAHIRQRVIDELPQSGSGKTIMTTQPNFVPNEAVELSVEDKVALKVRMIDCVGYMIPNALGHLEGEVPRMVRTPWFDYEVPFEEAAEIGTRKVITEHSTIGIVMTTDGSITSIPRSAYVEAEESVIAELKQQSKPFIIALNSTHPNSEETQVLRESLEIKYGVTTVAVDALNMNADEAMKMVQDILMEFPVRMLRVNVPKWISALGPEHYLSRRVIDAFNEVLPSINKMKDYRYLLENLAEIEDFMPAQTETVDLGSGNVEFSMKANDAVFYRVLGEECGFEIKDDMHLIKTVKDFAVAKSEYDKMYDALASVKRIGYGMVPPIMDQMVLDEPEIVQQGSRFGVRLKARASGMHLIRVDIESEISPLVGTEEQSEEFMAYLLNTFEKDPGKIWQTDIFGKPLYDLVREGMNSKVTRMPEEVQLKLQETLQRIVNDGCNGLVCIML